MEWAGTITDFNEKDIAKLDISRVSGYSWMVYQLLMRCVPHGNLFTYGDLASIFGSRGVLEQLARPWRKPLADIGTVS